MIAGSLTAVTNLRSGTVKMSATGSSTSRMNTASAMYSVATSQARLTSTRNAAVPDRVGDRRADADRRVVHDDVRELEHRLGHGLAPRDDRPAFLADHAERDAEEDAEDDDLEDVAFGHRLDDRLRDDVEEDLIPRLRLGGDLRLLPHRQVDADAGPHDVDGHQADEERERRHDLEVDERAQAHAADDLDVPGAGDAGDERREDQRRDDHLDHAQEDLAEGTEVERRGGVELADQPAGDDTEREADEICCVRLGPRRGWGRL